MTGIAELTRPLYEASLCSPAVPQNGPEAWTNTSFYCLEILNYFGTKVLKCLFAMGCVISSCV